MLETTVSCVRGIEPARLIQDPRALYVGRPVPRRGFRFSHWSNPFSSHGHGTNVDFGRVDADWFHATFTKDQIRTLPVSELYDRWLDTRPDLLARVPELVGRNLYCWCDTWRRGEPEIPCHAVRLAVRAHAWVDATIDDAIEERVCDLVGEWHESATGKPLSEWLGLTREQYAAWVEMLGRPEGYRPPGWMGDEAAVAAAREVLV